MGLFWGALAKMNHSVLVIQVRAALSRNKAVGC